MGPDDLNDTRPVDSETSPDLQTEAQKAIEKIKQRNTELGGHLAAVIPAQYSPGELIIFPSSLKHEVEQPDGAKKQVSDFLVLNQDGFKIGRLQGIH